jgi:exoribonuclease R
MDDLKSIARRAMLDHGLQPDFSAQALAQANAITHPSSDPASRDLRALLWASIDNDDSQDLDQLSVAEPLAGGTVKILVAIADVDATVKIGSPIDDHARANTTSVYTAAQVYPMLPEKLSTNLTSLADGQERVSLVIEMTIDAAGTLTGSEIAPSWLITAWRPGWTAKLRCPRLSPRLQEWSSRSGSRTRWHRR